MHNDGSGAVQRPTATPSTGGSSTPASSTPAPSTPAPSTHGAPIPSSSPGAAAWREPSPIDAGLAHDILPPAVRRLARFGSAAAARLAELDARRREIDGISRRLAAAAQGQCRDDTASPDLQRALRQLREAGLELLAEIDRAAQ